MASLLNRKRAILAKIEAIYGTDPVPTGAANAILISNLTPTPQKSQLVPRDLVRPYLGNSEQLPVAINTAITFEVEIAGAGAAGTAPAYGPLLRACGFSETIAAGVNVIYALVSSAFESVTLYFYLDGVIHKMPGARGSVALGFKNKTRPVYKFTFEGLYVAPADAALPASVFAAFIKPVPVNNINTAALSVHGFAGVVSDLQFDLAGKLVFRSLPGGTEQILITDRLPAGSISMEAATIATKDWFTIAKNATTGALSVTHGTVAGNKVKFDTPAVQLTNPTYGDEEGVAMLNAGLVYVPSAAGNDEATITVF